MRRPGLEAALGKEPAEVVYRNCCLFSPFTCEWEDTSIAVDGGVVVGLGPDYRGRVERDLSFARVVPGLIDSHVHIESSLLSPAEFGRLVLAHGTTTVVADPHEIANVAGAEGIRFMLEERKKTPLDIFYMLPSSVPATPEDVGGAVLTAGDLAPFLLEEGVLGLGEVMNVPGVLAGDPEVQRKLRLSPRVDGHAPGLSGMELNAYIWAGVQSDHESTGPEEAREKLRRGMHLMIREGSTERNLQALLPVVNGCTIQRCSFATDDRHADMLDGRGHIDDCIRTAMEYGLAIEDALRMATLSAAGRFGLEDRGAVAPGRLADFCVIAPGREFRVERTIKRGREMGDLSAPLLPPPFGPPVRARAPAAADLIASGQSGRARVIDLVPGQILTRGLEMEVDGASLPDTGQDILRAVVVERYRRGGYGIGLVHGFSLQEGAIAGSISHDAHQIVAVGADDAAIARAIAEVIRSGGALVAVSGDRVTRLPLPVGGLMSTAPYQEVVEGLGALNAHAEEMGSIKDPFMYLSFLALTVIPELRLTERGLVDVERGARVPLFIR
jgi:adenine deaminase